MNPQEPIETANITPDEASRIIHSHRKVRYGTACWPCRQRKVKCDNKQPCENCIKRDHAALCSYNPKNRDVGKASPTVAVAGVKRPRSPTPLSEKSIRRDEDRSSWPRTNDDDPNESRYLGQNSIAAFLSEETRAGQPVNDRDHDVIRQDVMPILGLQVSSAPYPFMSSIHMDQIRHDIASALPSDRDVLKAFQVYKQIVQPFWGLLIDIDDFETKLCIYLEDRSHSSRQGSPSSKKSVSSAWLGILFAVLAISANYSEQPYQKRAAASQTFVQAASHCLRLANFMVRPSLDSLQALLVLGFVLATDMKAEAAWALLGLTSRLAQALGLHRISEETARTYTPNTSDLSRRRLWWAIVWQDSLISLSFDRTPISVTTRCDIPLSPTAHTDGFTYLEAMYHLCQKILEDFHNDDSSGHTPSFAQITTHALEVENIRQQVVPALRLKEACKTVQDRLQYYALRLHTSFVVSVLCRPALRRGERPGMDHAQKAILAEKCKQNLTETVRMYLKMHSLSVIPTRSWAFTYHSLSSAVLLGILGETKTDPEVRQLQGDLISALSATAAKEKGERGEGKDGLSGKGESKEIELSVPLSRALAALRNIYDHGWVVEGQQNGSEPDSAVFDEQNAAVAMASMQGGGMPPLEYAPVSQLPINGGDMQTLEQTMNMSPMDLYDSIFWDGYDMNGMDLGGGMDFATPMLNNGFFPGI